MAKWDPLQYYECVYDARLSSFYHIRMCHCYSLRLVRVFGSLYITIFSLLLLEMTLNEGNEAESLAFKFIYGKVYFANDAHVEIPYCMPFYRTDRITVRQLHNYWFVVFKYHCDSIHHIKPRISDILIINHWHLASVDCWSSLWTTSNNIVAQMFYLVSFLLKRQELISEKTPFFVFV